MESERGYRPLLERLSIIKNDKNNYFFALEDESTELRGIQVYRRMYSCEDQLIFEVSLPSEVPSIDKMGNPNDWCLRPLEYHARGRFYVFAYKVCLCGEPSIICDKHCFLHCNCTDGKIESLKRLRREIAEIRSTIKEGRSSNKVNTVREKIEKIMVSEDFERLIQDPPRSHDQAFPSLFLSELIKNSIFGVSSEEVKKRKYSSSLKRFTGAIENLQLLAYMLSTPQLPSKLKYPLMKVVEDILSFGLVLIYPKVPAPEKGLVYANEDFLGNYFSCFTSFREPYLVYARGPSIRFDDRDKYTMFRFYNQDCYVSEEGIRKKTDKYFAWDWPSFLKPPDPIKGNIIPRHDGKIEVQVEKRAFTYTDLFFENFSDKLRQLIGRPTRELSYADYGCGAGWLSLVFLAKLSECFKIERISANLIEACPQIENARQLLKNSQNITLSVLGETTGLAELEDSSSFVDLKSEKVGGRCRIQSQIHIGEFKPQRNAFSVVFKNVDIALVSQLLDLYTISKIEESGTMMLDDIWDNTLDALATIYSRRDFKWPEEFKTFKIGRDLLSSYYYCLKMLRKDSQPEFEHVTRYKWDTSPIINSEKGLFLGEWLAEVVRNSRVTVLIDRFYDEGKLKNFANRRNFYVSKENIHKGDTKILILSPFALG